MKKYLSLPLEVNRWVAGAHSARVDQSTSIRNVIRLLLSTSYDECRFDPTFGSEVWVYDFDTSHSEKYWLSDLSQRFQERLRTVEPRLSNIMVRASVEQKDYSENNAGVVVKRAKRFLHLTVDAKLVSTNEDFRDTQIIVIGPLSFEQP
jgi:phage baseplate assembly protein W